MQTCRISTDIQKKFRQRPTLTPTTLPGHLAKLRTAAAVLAGGCTPPSMVKQILTEAAT